MIDKINSVRAELMKNERESLVSIWDACFPGEGNQGEEKQGTGNKVAASKSLLV
ncbi:hypothetical protein OW495_17275 [Vibrio sp. 14N.309.X.WAT.E.F5]|uniref:hypothetical protein n=1 Tax=Vibrio sp. 14N.309.X.WAT.E.F5 TaxID=2998321 RepID=UPI0025B0508A|nr:hypothetical protein [Vibrio sp. 14N.309.X.WAT.E.F5]MDN2668478.1 hypothetical protein [Vibrio sp. 14N.309.X.WAT.E.F5]